MILIGHRRSAGFGSRERTDARGARRHRRPPRFTGAALTFRRAQAVRSALPSWADIGAAAVCCHIAAVDVVAVIAGDVRQARMGLGLSIVEARFPVVALRRSGRAFIAQIAARALVAGAVVRADPAGVGVIGATPERARGAAHGGAAVRGAAGALLAQAPGSAVAEQSASALVREEDVALLALCRVCAVVVTEALEALLDSRIADRRVAVAVAVVEAAHALMRSRVANRRGARAMDLRRTRNAGMARGLAGGSV